MHQYIQVFDADLKFNEVSVNDSIVIIANDIINAKSRINSRKKNIVKRSLPFFSSLYISDISSLYISDIANAFLFS